MNLYALTPELITLLAALVLLIRGVFKGNSAAISQISIAQIAIVASLGFIALTAEVSQQSFYGMFVSNGFTAFCKMLVLIGTFLALMLSKGFYKVESKQAICEYPVLILLASTGMMLMISANNLLALYMALELQSLALYVLAAISRDNLKSSEAGLKYFVLGALSSGIILYGCSLIYGFSGTISFPALKLLLASGDISIGIIVGMVFLIVGICFKVSAVPFHMWTPDVYEGAPMPVTAYFAIAPKIAAIAIFVQILLNPFAGAIEQWRQVIIFAAAASMIVGALGAIQQTNIKRLIAYSSIGHVGYMLVGLAAAGQEGVKAIILYLFIYMTMSAGIFACIMMLKRKEGKEEDIYSLSGLAKSKPGMAVAIAILILSMAGIPPFAGFFGKFFILFAAVKQELYILSIIGVLASVVAAFYYLRIIKIMYFDESVVPVEKESPREMQYVALGATIFNVLFFVAFTPFVNAASQASMSLF